jgi:hypothetical protein
MEEKFNGLIEILKFLVEVDQGLSKEHTDWILTSLKELEELE